MTVLEQRPKFSLTLTPESFFQRVYNSKEKVVDNEVIYYASGMPYLEGYNIQLFCPLNHTVKN